MPTGIFIRTEKHKKNISKSLSGKPKPWLRKERIRKFCLCGKEFFLTPGRERPKHGKYCSRICFFKFRDNTKFLSFIGKRGKDNHNWKGNKVKYAALHLRVNQARGKAKVCEDCGSKKFVEWANLKGKYEDMKDYKSLCRKCHNKFDNIANRTAQTKKILYGNKYILKGWETRRNNLVLEGGGLRE